MQYINQQNVMRFGLGFLALSQTVAIASASHNKTVVSNNILPQGNNAGQALARKGNMKVIAIFSLGVILTILSFHYSRNVRFVFRFSYGIIMKPFSLSYGSCNHCGRTWNICNGHSTDYSPSGGCFPLCEECWNDLSINERVPHYLKLITYWESFGERIEKEKRDAIINAVLAGK